MAAARNGGAYASAVRQDAKTTVLVRLAPQKPMRTARRYGVLRYSAYAMARESVARKDGAPVVCHAFSGGLSFPKEGRKRWGGGGAGERKAGRGKSCGVQQRPVGSGSAEMQGENAKVVGVWGSQMGGLVGQVRVPV